MRSIAIVLFCLLLAACGGGDHAECGADYTGPLQPGQQPPGCET